jgi:hypothetical protein
MYEGERCGECRIHPSQRWQPGMEGKRLAVQPVWEQCPVCREIGLFEAAGQPNDEAGWHVVLVTPEEARRRAGLTPEQ